MKNTIALYVRMLFVMFVSFYSSRVVLDILGEVDYGIYNVVGGIVVMFSFLSTIFSSASQRYFAFDLGKGDYNRLSRVFNITFILYAGVVLFLLLLSETVGLWFLHNKLTIPAERMFTAHWVFQLSVISFCVTVLTTPYQSVIIAHEKMNVYAFVGVMEAVLTLACVFILKLCIKNADNLLWYSVLILIKVLFCQFLYYVYARKTFFETKVKFVWDRFLAKEMISYSWWNIFGGLSTVCRNQGINLLIGMFFSPAVNAARGLASGISGSLNLFSSNFFTAVRPQITKYYAQGDIDATLGLVYKSSKFSYFLIAFLAIPMITFMDAILDIWLVDVPAYTALFAQLVIVVALIDSMNFPLMTLMQATGHVKLYQLLTGGLIFMNVPFSYVFLKLGFGPEYTMYVSVFIAIACMFSRLLVCKRYVNIPLVKYLTEVLGRVLIVSSVCFLISVLFYYVAIKGNSNIIFMLTCLTIDIIMSIVIIFLLGLSASEKQYALNILKTKLLKRSIQR